MRRAAAIGRNLAERRSNSPPVGTPAKIVDNLGRWTDIGMQRGYTRLLDLSDLAHLELFAGEVIRGLGS